MEAMLRQSGLPLVGHHHSGIDDCHKIANLLMTLIKDGAMPEADAKYL